MSVLPGDGSTRDQLMEFVQNQLDRIDATARKGQQAELLEGLRMTGNSPPNRLQGGVHASTSCMLFVTSATLFYNLAPS